MGGKLFVDSTFGPPPLQYPFKFGADCIFHSGMSWIIASQVLKATKLSSGTKYFGGHSDLLCGILIVKTAEEREEVSFSLNAFDPLFDSRRLVMERPNLHGKYDGIIGVVASFAISPYDASPYSETVSKRDGNCAMVV